MTRSHPFRFGVIGEHMSSAKAWGATAQQAEQLGYSTLFIRDHFIPEPFGDQFAPMIALMAAADATKTLRVGSLVLDNDYRRPVILAKEAATLDVLSHGRFELGLGAGWAKTEYQQAGISFDAPGIRVGRLEEAVRVIKGLFADEPLTFSGAYLLFRLRAPAFRSDAGMGVKAGSPSGDECTHCLSSHTPCAMLLVNGTTGAPPLRKDGPQGWIPFSESLAERGTFGYRVARSPGLQARGVVTILFLMLIWRHARLLSLVWQDHSVSLFRTLFRHICRDGFETPFNFYVALPVHHMAQRAPAHTAQPVFTCY